MQLSPSNNFYPKKGLFSQSMIGLFKFQGLLKSSEPNLRGCLVSAPFFSNVFRSHKKGRALQIMIPEFGEVPCCRKQVSPVSVGRCPKPQPSPRGLPVFALRARTTRSPRSKKAKGNARRLLGAAACPESTRVTVSRVFESILDETNACSCKLLCGSCT